VRPLWRLRRGFTSTKSDRSDGLSRFPPVLHEGLPRLPGYLRRQQQEIPLRPEEVLA
jgi:hypothetical protein